MKKRIRPLIRKYNVNAYFSGDEHGLEHFSESSLSYSSMSLEYIISGGMSFLDTSMGKNLKQVKSEYVKFFWNVSHHNIDCINCSGGFVFYKATSREINCTFITTNNEVIYSMTIFPRKRYFHSNYFISIYKEYSLAFNILVAVIMLVSSYIICHLFSRFWFICRRNSFPIIKKKF